MADESSARAKGAARLALGRMLTILTYVCVGLLHWQAGLIDFAEFVSAPRFGGFARGAAPCA